MNTATPMMSKGERLARLYEVLKEKPAANSPAEAWQLVAAELALIEQDHVPAGSDKMKILPLDDWMVQPYGPGGGYIPLINGDVRINANGAIGIYNAYADKYELQKAGADGHAFSEVPGWKYDFSAKKPKTLSPGQSTEVMGQPVEKSAELQSRFVDLPLEELTLIEELEPEAAHQIEPFRFWRHLSFALVALVLFFVVQTFGRAVIPEESQRYLWVLGQHGITALVLGTLLAVRSTVPASHSGGDMPTNKRITDLSDYTSVLPYASELFGVYQPLIGWKSKRVLKRINKRMNTGPFSRFAGLVGRYQGIVSTHFDGCFIGLDNYRPGVERRVTLRPQTDSALLSSISRLLGETERIPDADGWREIINRDRLQHILNEEVFPFHAGIFRERCTLYARINHGEQNPALQSEVVDALKTESAIAGALIGYVENEFYDKLEAFFYIAKTPIEDVLTAVGEGDFSDPYLSFDPKKDVKDVSLSPVGIVHLYRQYFFELDTFLGTPVSHVWLSPGSSVELIEISTRKTITEKTIETSLETTTTTERSSTSQEEISEAVKQDNKDDMKLGFSTTVNQSWGTGNATATGSLNLDKTQQVAREQTQKRSRQQTEKLSTEIRQNFKTTFRTVTENTDTTSKRYLLNNSTKELINYELRRKMRQVGVQIQDVGSYLCWETFVDEPGLQLGLPDLVHIATPADLVLVPNPKLIPMPPLTIQVGFTGEMEWFFPENQQQRNGPDGFHRLNTISIPPIPEGYEVQNKGAVINVAQEVVVMEDDDSEFFKGMLAKGKVTNDGLYVDVGLVLGSGGLKWDEGRIRFKVSGSIDCKLNDTKKNEITTANDALISEKLIANNENQRKQEEAFRKTASERITLASRITKRKFEDLREEERTIVYRNLIKSLMTEQHYKNLPDNQTGFETRHVLSELINSIFDIDKMLYFVAPEWWKPRKLGTRATLNIGDAAIADSINGSVVNWSDKQPRSDNYFITDKSDPAPLGSSLGWLLQLDGDDLRNAFLNAPWVKAVIPIRPGKEKAAVAWLQNVNVEGSDGLDAIYSAPDDELVRINVYLGSGKVPRQFTDAEWADISAATAPDPVTIKQALEFLCAEVGYKEVVSKTISKYPKEEINDDNKVLATPIEKVYEHGFYPLKGGFKAVVEDYFETISQWIEVLPTDQVVPVEVKYNPETGRQL